MARALRLAGYAGLGSVVAAAWLALDGADSAGLVLPQSTPSAVDWVVRNLGWSAPLFTAAILAWMVSMRSLGRALRQHGNAKSTGHLDQLADTWAQLCFGIGVIWTAIGMRNALIYSLSGQAEAMLSGADKLARMVDGGILLALSTTIFGGIAGYLMRVTKTVAYGEALRQHYEDRARSDLVAIRDRLESIQDSLATAARPRDAHEPTAGDHPG